MAYQKATHWKTEFVDDKNDIEKQLITGKLKIKLSENTNC